MLFSLAMVASYVLSFQIYLALPLQASTIVGDGFEAPLVSALFIVSALVAVLGQMRITRWLSARWGTGRSLAIGISILAIGFVPVLAIPDSQAFGVGPAVAALLISAAVLAVGTAAVFPFEKDTVVSLSCGRLVATHYGF